MKKTKEGLQVEAENFNEVKINVDNAKANENLFESENKVEIKPGESLFQSESSGRKTETIYTKDLFANVTEASATEETAKEGFFTLGMGIVLGCLVVLGYVVYVVRKHRNKKMKKEVSETLRREM